MTAPTPAAPRAAQPTLSRPAAALCGLLGVGSALAAGDLVAGLTDPATSPFLSVGNQFIRITPEWLKQLAITTFGTYDKVALLAGMAAVIAVAGVVAGLASRRSPVPGLAVILAMGLLALTTAALSPTFSAVDLLPPVTSALVGAVVFAVLHRAFRAAGPSAAGPDTAPPAPEPDTAAPAPGPEAAAPAPGGIARRRAVVLAGGVLAGTVVTGLAGRLLAAGGPPGTTPEAVGPLPAVPRPRLPAGADFASSGTPAFVTPTRDFYRIDTALQVPRLGTGDYALRLHGMVDRELTWTFEQLRARRLIEVPITMTCVSNGVGGDLVSTAVFLGVPLAELLREAGIRSGAEQVFATSVDGFTTGTPLGALTDGRDAMLAIGMNGAPLPVEHGFPVRMVVPGLYGFVSGCKWLTDLEVTTWAARTSYWEQRDWAREAPVKPQSRIDAPRPDQSVPAGRVVVAGTAWAQHIGVDRVEVLVDDGAWQSAELSTEVSIDTWRMWRIPVELGPGPHRLQVRTTDRTGTVQTAREQVSIPDGATGRHTIAVTAV